MCARKLDGSEFFGTVQFLTQRFHSGAKKSEYKLIQSVDDLNDMTSYFDDSIVRECIIRTQGCVDEEFRMRNDWGLFDLRMLVQIQDKETPAMEILFSDVLKFELTDIFIPPPEGRVVDDCWRITKFVGDEKLTKENMFFYSMIVAKRIEYRFLDKSYLGENASLIRE